MRPKSGIVLLQSRVMSADFSHVDPAAAHEVGRSLQWDQPFAEMQSMGHFLQSRPRAIRLASFDAQSPFGQDATYISLAPHLVPTGSDSRELLVRDLARADLDTIMVGGLMLPLGQEESLRSIVTAYRRLPKGKFSNIPGKHDPLVLRKSLLREPPIFHSLIQHPGHVGSHYALTRIGFLRWNTYRLRVLRKF